MLSSSFRDLTAHRDAVLDAMPSSGILPVAAEYDAALPAADIIAAALRQIEQSDAYVGIIGCRYGPVPKCPERNPLKLSLAELEFRHAVALSKPVCTFLVLPLSGEVQGERGTKARLAAFRRLAAGGPICAEYDSVEDLRTKAGLSFNELLKMLHWATSRQAPQGLSQGGGAAISGVKFDPLNIPDKAGGWPRYVVELARSKRWLAVPILAAILPFLFGIWWLSVYGKGAYERWLTPPYYTMDLPSDAHWQVLEGFAPIKNSDGVLRFPAGTLAVYDPARYRLKELENSHFRVKLSPQTKTVTWVIRLRDRRYYFAARCEYQEKSFTVEAFVTRNKDRTTCIPLPPKPWPMFPLREGDVLLVDKLSVTKNQRFSWRMSVAGRDGLTASESLVDMARIPMEITGSICDPDLDDGQFGFQTGPGEALLVFDEKIKGK